MGQLERRTTSHQRGESFGKTRKEGAFLEEAGREQKRRRGLKRRNGRELAGDRRKPAGETS